MSDVDMAVVASRVRLALDAPEVEQFADLLDPNVTWGAPDDPRPTCQNRGQVLRWYERGRAEGRRGEVVDLTTNGDKILITMNVSTPDGDDAQRWQVLTVRAGLIADIRGYDEEGSARSAAGLP